MKTRIRRLGMLFAAGALLVATALPAGGITWGGPDTTDEYPAVGAIMIDWRVVGAPEFGLGIYCSGTLIHPQVFLTAGHCAEGLVADGLTDANGVPTPGVGGKPDVWVSFEADPSEFNPPPSKTRCDSCLDIARVVNSPLYHWGPTSDPHDIAAIILAEPAPGIAPMPYAELGDLEDLRRVKKPRSGEARELFTVVGYGGSFIDPPPWGIEYLDHRAIAQSAFQNLHNAWLRVSQNQAKGDEGTCFGDSGGPILRDMDGEEVVVGVTSWGDTTCASMGFYYRVDITDSQDFIESVIDEAEAS